MRATKCSLLIMLAVIVTLPAVLDAQSRPLQGTFAYDAQASDDVEEAIRVATGRMNFALRGIARGRLRRTNEPYRQVTLAHTTSNVTITTDARAPIVTPATGSAIRWTREDGEVLDVSTTWENDALRQSFVADDGRRDNVFTLSPDGNTLKMTVTVQSGRLPQPLRYTLVYLRTS
jgi:hypothetical protein